MRGRLSAPAATVLLLAGIAGCSGSSGPGDRPSRAPAARLIAYGGCDALLEDLRSATAEKVGPTGFEGLPVLPGDQVWALGRPVLVGPSRKRFLRRLLEESAPGRPVDELALDTATAGACLAAVAAGAHVLRVHNVVLLRRALIAYSSIRAT